MAARMITGLLALLNLVPAPDVPAAAPPSDSDIDSRRLLDHIRVLSSDAFEGRAPGTVGEDKSVDYIIKQFKAPGLQPGNPDGTYVQKVPIMGVLGEPARSPDAHPSVPLMC